MKLNSGHESANERSVGVQCFLSETAHSCCIIFSASDTSAISQSIGATVATACYFCYRLLLRVICLLSAASDTCDWLFNHPLVHLHHLSLTCHFNSKLKFKEAKLRLLLNFILSLSIRLWTLRKRFVDKSAKLLKWKSGETLAPTSGP